MRRRDGGPGPSQRGPHFRAGQGVAVPTVAGGTCSRRRHGLEAWERRGLVTRWGQGAKRESSCGRGAGTEGAGGRWRERGVRVEMRQPGAAVGAAAESGVLSVAFVSQAIISNVEECGGDRGLVHPKEAGPGHGGTGWLGTWEGAGKQSGLGLPGFGSLSTPSAEDRTCCVGELSSKAPTFLLMEDPRGAGQ